MSNDDKSRAKQGVYGITVASELSGFGTQALRFYEQHGLINPARTSGGTRRYSDDDLLRLRRIAELIADGVNLTGIARVLDLEHLNTELASDNDRLVEANSRLESDNARLRRDGTRAERA
ncbi:MerR family transcriptional regulator [Rhodococcus opacus]|uniref:MerR family transcriptional regulator n=1 Tax=Rhodococcus TaxID=1827 RepID=UPI000EA9D1AE|nr:MerR family transcriptional regulator [Rhodococcus opacus]NHU46790.1 MerR family transcriptional regulator [Rhodococcus sp. A14]QZS59338.1 MerR family transcriptional regulator [Rhodococcus opacus]RKM74083.1 MerR family transcriptional regulator [Rhodococcus opacus]UNM98777.1 MerR family transcriptional regulator [Rhodococcus opacus]